MLKVIVYEESRRGRPEIAMLRPGYRWRAKTANGRIIADSAEAYTRRGDADRAARTAIALFSGDARIYWEDTPKATVRQARRVRR